MKFFVFLAACACVVSILSLDGCTQTQHPSPSSVSQRQAPYQTPSAQNASLGTAVGGTNGTVVSASTPVAAAPAPGKMKAAILLPLSGKNAALGQAMLNAAQQAVFDAAGTNFELQPRDTAAEGGPEDAARAAVNGGAHVIIGPLFATDIPAAMPIAQIAGLQMLTLSTDTSLAQRGIYVMGLAPTQQVERMVSYAVAHGAHNFAALIPATPYGNLVGQAFHNSVDQHGGNVIDYETYNAVTPEGIERAKVLATQHDRIDALFLPESGAELKTLADQLAAAGIDPTHTHIFGTGLWDVPGLGKQSALLIGAWYAAPDPTARRNFVASYAAAYGQEPPRLATLAYDATALAAVIAKHGARYDEASLTNPNGFAGLDGIFRLTPSGMVERGLAINEVTAEGARVIDPAPTSFVGRH